MQALSGPSSALLDQSISCYYKDWTPTPSTTFKYRPVSQVSTYPMKPEHFQLNYTIETFCRHFSLGGDSNQSIWKYMPLETINVPKCYHLHSKKHTVFFMSIWICCISFTYVLYSTLLSCKYLYVCRWLWCRTGGVCSDPWGCAFSSGPSSSHCCRCGHYWGPLESATQTQRPHH